MGRTRIGAVTDIISGVGFPVDMQGQSSGDLPFLKVSDLRSADRTVVRAANFVSRVQARELGARICPSGTVVFPKVGGALLTNLRRTLGVEAVFDNNVMGLVPRSVDSDWLYYQMCAIDLAALANTQSLPSIRQSQVDLIPIDPPPLDEQRRIAARLREQLHDVDGLVASATAQHDELAHLRTRVYETAFPTTPLSVAAESAGPDGWTWQSLGSLGRLESGHTPSRSRPDWWGGDIPWIALPDIRALDGRQVFETQGHTNPEGIAHSAARVLAAGTVVLSRTASVGFVTIMGRPMATSQDFVNWVCGPDLDPEFLMHLFIRSRERFRSLSAGAVHQTVYFPTAMALRVCVPSIDAQRQIVERLREQLAEIDRAKAALEMQRKAVDALPAALLHEVFRADGPASGRVR
jgi:type I restriction enzyme S subunit